ncbi:DnaD domain protein [Bacillus sp. REN16]|uniref:DnaD domain protein n=1 Tax=Bacillus sp. REN16 TaxID=2887296 RepID=UPI001E4D0775|nr:DnaD domain protein [Bacillus sp. REN16]MCC3359633.1 DnaD domain protein [Bacillus sp. REN16]
MNEKLLLNESPLLIIPTLAALVGRNESVILQQIHYWLLRTDNIREERKWVYITYDELAKQIGYISKSTIRRAISKLEKNGFLTPGNFNKMKIDHTKWYSINYEKLEELKPAENNEVEAKNETPQPDHKDLMCPNQADDVPKVDSPSAQNEQTMCSTWTDDVSNMSSAIPEITAKITTENTTETSSSSKDVQPNNEKEDPFQFFEQNGFGTIGSFLADKINAWCTDLSDNLVIEAMKLAVENSSKRWNYVEAILRDWVDKGYKTLDDVHAARLAYKHQMNRPSMKKLTRQELLPDWFHDRSQDDKPEHNFNFAKEKRIIVEQMKELREYGCSIPKEPVHNPSFDEKKRLFEERMKKDKHLG